MSVNDNISEDESVSKGATDGGQKDKQKVMDLLANKLVEIQTSGRSVQICWKRINEVMTERISSEFLGDHVDIVETGSAAECVTVGVCNDFDCMMILPNIKVCWSAQNNTESFLLCEHTAHPLYVKLKLCNITFTYRLFMIDKNGYLSNSTFMDFNSNTLRDIGIAVDVDGPALTHTTNFHNRKFDSVFCLRCSSWPAIANEFFIRTKQPDWPFEDLLNRVAKVDCLLVATGHPCSSSRDTEWRLSFSLAEKILIQEFPQPYADCLAALKAVKYRFITFDCPICTPPTPFSSYFIKTACLWMCEANPRETNTTKIVRKVLDWLIDCYRNRNLPHYFISQQNLISHIQPKVCEMVSNRLTAVKEDIWWMVMVNVYLGYFNTKQFVRKYMSGKWDTTPWWEYKALEYILLNHPTAIDDVKIKFMSLEETRLDRSEIETVIVLTHLNDRFNALNTYLELEASKANYFEIMKIPELIVMPIIDTIAEVVLKDYTDMFKTRLHQYLGDVFTFLLSQLQSKCSENMIAIYKLKPLEYYNLAGEVVWPDKWSDHGIVSLACIVKYHYVMGNLEEVNNALIRFKHLLASEKKFYKCRLPGIDIFSFGSLSYRQWDADALLQSIVRNTKIPSFSGDDEHLAGGMHPIAFVLYIEARLLLTKGKINDALQKVKEIKSHSYAETRLDTNLYELISLLNEEKDYDWAHAIAKTITKNKLHYTQNKLLVKILEALVGLLRVAYRVFDGKKIETVYY